VSQKSMFQSREEGRQEVLENLRQLLMDLKIPGKTGRILGGFLQDEGWERDKWLEAEREEPGSGAFAMGWKKRKKNEESNNPRYGKKQKELAKEFARVVRKWTTPKELEEINYRNQTDPEARSGLICHTHDFIDGNEAMLQAMETLGIEFRPASQRNVDLIQGAWNYAKGSLFRP